MGQQLFVSSGQGAGKKEAEILMMPGGWGFHITALVPVTDLMTRHKALL